MGAAVQFDAESHEYRAEGAVVPHVTGVLDALNLRDLPPNRPERELWLFRGNWVDTAISLKLLGKLDVNDPAFLAHAAQWMGFVMGGLRFIRETGAAVISVQRQVYHPTYRFAGTLDLEIDIPHRGLAICDWKLNEACVGTHLQLAAYDLAASAEPEYKPHRRIAVALHPDGTYKTTEYQGRQDRQLFLSALALYNDKNRNGGKDGSRNGNGHH